MNTDTLEEKIREILTDSLAIYANNSNTDIYE